VSWRTGARTPSGVYLYRVLADGHSDSGKLVRVD